MMALSRQWVVFCRAGAICWLLRLPSPHSANPSFFWDAAARARVTLVLMKGAAAIAAACAMNVRRAVILSYLPTSAECSAEGGRGAQVVGSAGRFAAVLCRAGAAAGCEAVDGAQLVTDGGADGEHAGLEQIVLTAVHELDPIAALYFGRVERLVCELDRAAGTALGRRHDRGDTDTDRHS